jgi:hypothetical protein
MSDVATEVSIMIAPTRRGGARCRYPLHFNQARLNGTQKLRLRESNLC